jgi:hypothetical protein
MIRSSKFRTNLERNEKIYFYWKQGKTIKETALITGIPESTVGYYFAKFDRLTMAGKPIPIAQKMVSTRGVKQVPLLQKGPQGDVAALQFFLDTFHFKFKCTDLFFIHKLLIDGKYQDLYYLLNSLNLFKEVKGMLKVTEEEYRLFLTFFPVFEKYFAEHKDQLKFVPPYFL